MRRSHGRCCRLGFPAACVPCQGAAHARLVRAITAHDGLASAGRQALPATSCVVLADGGCWCYLCIRYVPSLAEWNLALPCSTCHNAGVVVHGIGTAHVLALVGRATQGCCATHRRTTWLDRTTCASGGLTLGRQGMSCGGGLAALGRCVHTVRLAWMPLASSFIACWQAASMLVLMLCSCHCMPQSVCMSVPQTGRYARSVPLSSYQVTAPVHLWRLVG